MSARDPGPVRVIPVQRIRPGDHAFVGYDGDEAQWDVPSAFVRLGLARGEKVIVYAAPGLPEDEVLGLLRLDGPVAETTRARGQLVLSGMRELLGPGRAFTAARQTGRLREETDRAVGEGFTGLRTYIDMRWVADLDVDIATMVDRETHADHLFDDRPYTEICAYDRRAFDAEVLDAMSRAHPLNLLSRLGALQAVHGTASLALIGEADLTTCDELRAALDKSLAQTAGQHSCLTVDLGGLHFLGVASADELLRTVRRLGGALQVQVRCSTSQAHVLRRLGANSVHRLDLIETRPEW